MSEKKDPGVNSKEVVKKKKRGAPAKYPTVEEFQSKIDEYFEKFPGQTFLYDDEGNIVKDEKNKPLNQIKPPTVAGLALYLGFLDRRSIYDYADRSERFSHAVKRAIIKIEEFAESQLYGGKPVGAIFWLKNHNWQDRQEVEHSGDITFNVKPVTDEKYKKLFEKKKDEKE